MPLSVIDAAPAGTSARTVASSPGEPVLFNVTSALRGYENRIAGSRFTNVTCERRMSTGLCACPGSTSELAGAAPPSASAATSAASSAATTPRMPTVS